jgi:transcriptional regulator with XRE-family HTH domain
VINPDIVKSRRQQKSWSQEQLAELSGLSLRTVQRIEKRGTASLESTKALASVFGVDIASLSVGAEDSTRQEVSRVALRYIAAGAAAGLILGLIGGALGLSQAMNSSAGWGCLAFAVLNAPLPLLLMRLPKADWFCTRAGSARR